MKEKTPDYEEHHLHFYFGIYMITTSLSCLSQ